MHTVALLLCELWHVQKVCVQACCLLPTQLPVNISNLNWASIMGVFVVGLALAAWFFPVHGARNWYKGKAHTLRDADVVSSSLRVDRLSAASYMIKLSFPN